MAGGDARIALNALELAVMTTNMDKENQYHITMDVMVDCVQKSLSGSTSHQINTMTISAHSLNP